MTTGKGPLPFKTAVEELQADPAYQAATAEEKLNALEMAAMTDGMALKSYWRTDQAPQETETFVIEAS